MKASDSKVFLRAVVRGQAQLSWTEKRRVSGRGIIKERQVVQELADQLLHLRFCGDHDDFRSHINDYSIN